MARRALLRRASLAGLVLALSAGCGEELPRVPPPTPVTSPTATAPASPSALAVRARFDAVRRCLDEAGLVSTEARPVGRSARGLLVSPATELYFYVSPAAARRDLVVIRRRPGGDRSERARSDVIVVHDEVLGAGEPGRRTLGLVEKCL